MQRRVKRTIAGRCLLLSIVMLLGVSLPVWAKAAGGDLPVVKIVYWRSIDDLPLYVGVEKGYFETAGVKVQLEFIKPADTADNRPMACVEPLNMLSQGERPIATLLFFI